MTRNRVSISLLCLVTRFIYSTAIDTGASILVDLVPPSREWEIDDRCTRRNLLDDDAKATDKTTSFHNNLIVEGSRIISSARKEDSLGLESFSLLNVQKSDSKNGLRLRGSQSSRSSEDKNYHTNQRDLQGFIQAYLDNLEGNQEENNQQEGGQPVGDPQGGAQQIQQFPPEDDQLGDDQQMGGDQLVDDQEEIEHREGDQSYEVTGVQLGGGPQEVAQQIQQFQTEGSQWEDNQQVEGDVFHMRLHWYPGACWQEEWREREWCMQCPGNQCDEGEWLWVKECAPIPTQRFQWVPNNNININDSTSSEGQLKMAFWNLCLEKIDNKLFNLHECDASNQNQFFIRLSTGVAFELHPAHDTSMCLTQHHHPKDYEEVYGMSCADARHSHTNYWDTNWQGEQDFNLHEYETCTSSQPCGRCAGDCDDDSDCEEGLKCFFRNDITPVPGCSGIGRFGT